ncbi:MAG: DUF368 domain-containing protein [Eubacteriales bacterium]
MRAAGCFRRDICLSLGVYEKMLAALGGLFRAFRRNMRYLLPGVGGVIGILLTSNVLSLVIARYRAQLLSLFTGLVLNGLSELYAEVRLDGPKLVVLRYRRRSVWVYFYYSRLVNQASVKRQMQQI